MLMPTSGRSSVRSMRRSFNPASVEAPFVQPVVRSRRFEAPIMFYRHAAPSIIVPNHGTQHMAHRECGSTANSTPSRGCPKINRLTERRSFSLFVQVVSRIFLSFRPFLSP